MDWFFVCFVLAVLSLHCPVAGRILVQCRILVPLRGIKPMSPALEGRVITMGPSRKSQEWVAFENQLECSGCSIHFLHTPGGDLSPQDRPSRGQCWGGDGDGGCSQPNESHPPL